MVVVKNPKEQRSQKSRGFQWSHRRVVEGRGKIGTVLAENRRSLERRFQVSHPKNSSWFGSFFPSSKAVILVVRGPRSRQKEKSTVVAIDIQGSSVVRLVRSYFHK